ncbi:MAG TPA: cell division protein FtsZ [bacterium]|nr:cell division protein FtsZ [bacterium]
MFELVEEEVVQGAKIKVIGVGGAGGNAVNTMIEQWSASGLERVLSTGGIDFIAANTDLQALKGNRANVKMQLGKDLTRGLGAGADPEVGRKAAIESEAEVTKLLEGADMIFITAGMGGGTGTGAAPVIARIARDLGALTIGVVTKPFSFEGKRRSRFAQQGLDALEESVDSLISIPNERLLVVAGKQMALTDAFKMADEVLLHAVRGISDLILVEGLINLDFADIRTVMSTMGTTLMGSGFASGEHRANEAATRAVSSPLLENISIRGATGILLNVTGGPDLTLFEVNEAAKLIQEEAHEDANIIFGAVVDPTLGSQVRVTVIATGFEKATKRSSEFVPYKKQPSREPVMEIPLAASSMPEPALQEVEMEEPAPRSVPSGRPRIPVPSDLKRMMGDYRMQDFMSREADADEYDIPTFLRKHAD